MGELRTSVARNVVALALVALVVGCEKPKGTGHHADAGVPVPTSSVPRDAKGLAVHVAGPRPPVRDATFVGPAKDGVTVTARVMVSKVTPADGVHVALRFAIDPARLGASPTWPLAGTRVVVTEQGAKPRTFEVAAPSTGTGETLSPSMRFPLQLALDARGVATPFTPAGASHAWKTEGPLLSALGKTTVRIEGTLAGPSGSVAFSTADLPIEVAPASASLVSRADVVAEATRQVVAHGLGAPAGQRVTVVDDVTDGRWVRFSLGDHGYHVSIVDALVAPTGKLVALQEFTHFTCVARGTAVATPRGDVPIETLAPGDVVWGWDEAHGAKVATSVRAVVAAERDGLVQLGALRVTAEHPVLADGRWTPAADVREGATLVTLPSVAEPVAHPVWVPGWADVLDLSVGPPHTFFAAGVLVHNKAVAVELAPGDPWRGAFLRTTDPR